MLRMDAFGEVSGNGMGPCYSGTGRPGPTSPLRNPGAGRSRVTVQPGPVIACRLAIAGTRRAPELALAEDFGRVERIWR